MISPEILWPLHSLKNFVWFIVEDDTPPFSRIVPINMRREPAALLLIFQVFEISSQ